MGARSQAMADEGAGGATASLGTENGKEGPAVGNLSLLKRAGVSSNQFEFMSHLISQEEQRLS